ncbi:TPA: hypothetical protein SAO52_005139 [Burkholderia vietnamiensis]|nr:hypothetical protein [Burkholderia vietnamiensis]
MGDFLAWCAGAGVRSVTAVQPLHVAAWIERQTQTRSAPTVKQQLAASLPEKWWLARECRGDGQSCVDAHYAAV